VFSLLALPLWSLSLLSHFPQMYVNFSTCHENDIPRWWIFTYKLWVQTFVMSVRFLMVKLVLEQVLLVIFHIFTYWWLLHHFPFLCTAIGQSLLVRCCMLSVDPWVQSRVMSWDVWLMKWHLSRFLLFSPFLTIPFTVL
jgi:hypothetical protein